MSELILSLILKYSLLTGLDPTLVTSIIQVESGFNITAVGPVGELGLMQLRPEYFPNYTREQLFNPDTNIKLGTRHLASKMKRCKHQIDYTNVICFNTGVKGASKIKNPQQFPYYKKVMSVYENVR